MTQKFSPKMALSHLGRLFQNLVRFFGIIAIGLIVASIDSENASYGARSEETIKPFYLVEFFLAYFLSFIFPALAYILISKISLLKSIFIFLFCLLGIPIFSVLGRFILEFGPVNFQEAATGYSRYQSEYSDIGHLGHMFVIFPYSFLFLLLLELVLYLTKPFLVQKI
jgi:hypothetical protein